MDEVFLENKSEAAATQEIWDLFEFGRLKSVSMGRKGSLRYDTRKRCLLSRYGNVLLHWSWHEWSLFWKVCLQFIQTCKHLYFRLSILYARGRGDMKSCKKNLRKLNWTSRIFSSKALLSCKLDITQSKNVMIPVSPMSGNVNNFVGFTWKLYIIESSKFLHSFPWDSPWYSSQNHVRFRIPLILKSWNASQLSQSIASKLPLNSHQGLGLLLRIPLKKGRLRMRPFLQRKRYAPFGENAIRLEVYSVLMENWMKADGTRNLGSVNFIRLRLVTKKYSNTRNLLWILIFGLLQKIPLSSPTFIRKSSKNSIGSVFELTWMFSSYPHDYISLEFIYQYSLQHSLWLVDWFTLQSKFVPEANLHKILLRIAIECSLNFLQIFSRFSSL